ncbi:neuronal pentraxin-1 [Geothlypis trichas]
MAAGPPGSRLLPLLLLLGPALGPALGQGLGQTRFICTSVPLDGDVCAASALGTGSAEELKGTVLQLRETVLQQKETIMNQKETIRELTAKLGRCESQSVLELPGEGKGRKGFSKNTMGDLSRPAAAETLSQLGQTLQSLKTRLENLEQFSRMNSSSQTNNLKDILQNKIDDLEKQVLSRVNSLEEGKLSPRNESEERGKIESTLTSLHQRISDLEKGTGRCPPPGPPGRPPELPRRRDRALPRDAEPLPRADQPSPSRCRPRERSLSPSSAVPVAGVGTGRWLRSLPARTLARWLPRRAGARGLGKEAAQCPHRHSKEQEAQLPTILPGKKNPKHIVLTTSASA